MTDDILDQEQELEGEAPAKQQAGEAQKKQDYVPLSALESERKKRQELEGSLNETRTKLEELTSLRDELAEWKKSQVKDIDYWDNPKGYVDNVAQKATKSLEDIQKRNEELNQQLEYNNQVTQVRALIESQANEFRESHDDYDKAYRYVQNIQRSNLELGGVENSQINRLMAANEIQVASTLAQNNINYPGYIYAMAKNMGYNPETNTKEADQLDTIEKGQKRSTKGGTGKLGEMGNMGTDEFDAAMEEVFGFLKR